MTTTTLGRASRFADPLAARTACAAIADPHTWLPSRLLAWVLMPDHWHGLVELADGDRLMDAMRRFK